MTDMRQSPKRKFYAPWLLFFFLGTKTLSADPASYGSDKIQVIPMPKTAESNTVSLTLSYPKAGHFYKKSPIWMQFRLDGYPLGAGSKQFERGLEISNSKIGQCVYVIIDDELPFPVFEPNLDPFDQSGYFYNTSYRFEVPFPLKSGAHTVRMFPVRSYGESLKGDRTFQAIDFWVGERGEGSEVDLRKPYLTYNQPGNDIPLFANKPILLDFYICNCELSQDGYKVELNIDGTVERMLTSWQPYFLYGLSKGTHTIRLRLLSPNGNPVGGPFNDVTRKISVQ